MSLRRDSSVNSETPRRVHIVGGPGSGKTTLARRLASNLRAPVYDLDEITFEGGAGPKRSLEVRLEDLKRIASQPSWITESVFLWWTDELLRSADVIVWLDVPWRVAAWRVILRHLKTNLAGTNRHRGLRRLVRFLRWSHLYYRAPVPATAPGPDDNSAVSRLLTAEYLDSYSGKLVHCRSASDVTAFCAALGDL